MNMEQLTDAISALDSDLLEVHFKTRHAVQRKAQHAWMRWTSGIAACLLILVMFGPSLVINMGGASSADPSYDITHTDYVTYEEVAAVLPVETLFSRLDTEGMVDISWQLTHAENNPANPSALDMVATTKTGTFLEIALLFPSALPYGNGSPANGTQVTVGSTTVLYRDRSQDSQYDMSHEAVFEYDGCRYTVRARGTDMESEFWELLNELLSN